MSENGGNMLGIVGVNVCQRQEQHKKTPNPARQLVVESESSSQDDYLKILLLHMAPWFVYFMSRNWRMGYNQLFWYLFWWCFEMLLNIADLNIMMLIFTGVNQVRFSDSFVWVLPSYWLTSGMVTSVGPIKRARSGQPCRSLGRLTTVPEKIEQTYICTILRGLLSGME